jgi:hypothetical protein
MQSYAMGVRVLQLRDLSNPVMKWTHRRYLGRPASRRPRSSPTRCRSANAVHTPSSDPSTELDLLATLMKNQDPFSTTDALNIRSDARRHNSDIT